MNTSTDQISDYKLLYRIYRPISSMWAYMSFIMKNLESPIQDQISILFIPEEFPLYFDFLLYGSSFAEKDEGT